MDVSEIRDRLTRFFDDMRFACLSCLRSRPCEALKEMYITGLPER